MTNIESIRSINIANPNSRVSSNSDMPSNPFSPSLQRPPRTCFRSSSNLSTTSSSTSSSSGSMVTATTSTAPILKPKIIRTNHQVRSKFLSKIGIVDVYTNANASSASVIHPPSASSPIPSRDLHNVPRFREPLKYNRQEERLRHDRKSTTLFSSPWSSKSNSSIVCAFVSFKSENDNKNSLPGTTKKNTTGGKKRISFEESVDVIPIPMRSEYSDRIRYRLWNNASEIHENAARNAVEFASENWDWRTVYHEEDMYICCITGELIHPAHYQSSSQPMPIFGE
ncbi:hypothetical protein ACHAXS_005537 [Conticribra weissflogii]